jgi:cell wall-associated NlpC family hydrolase
MARPSRPVRRPLNPSRALLTLVVAGGVALAPLPATAAPDEPDTSREAAALVATKGHELEIVSERVNEARERLKQQQAAAKQAAAEVEKALAALDAAREQVRVVARGAYTGSQLTAIQVLLASESPEDLLNRVGTLNTIARYNGGVLGDATEADAAARQARKTADAAATKATALVRTVTSQQKSLDRQVEEYKADYRRLVAKEEAAREAARQAAERAARDASERASRATRSAPTTHSAPARVSAPSVSAGSGGSGAARAAVSLPHSSGMQSGMGYSVSRSAMAPGDLLFFYSPVSHVAMYIGNGQMVHASTYGVPVKVVPVSSMPGLVSVRRVA